MHTHSKWNTLRALLVKQCAGAPGMRQWGSVGLWVKGRGLTWVRPFCRWPHPRSGPSKKQAEQTVQRLSACTHKHACSSTRNRSHIGTVKLTQTGLLEQGVPTRSHTDTHARMSQLTGSLTRMSTRVRTHSHTDQQMHTFTGTPTQTTPKPARVRVHITHVHQCKKHE